MVVVYICSAINLVDVMFEDAYLKKSRFCLDV